jgi:periplasmic protein CpxP/Spy
MKNFVFAAMLLFATNSFAQADNQSEMDLTPQQRSELHLKKMTLDLDLRPAQQKEMAKVIADQTAMMDEQRKERQAAENTKTLTADEKFAKRSARLDHQISMRQRVKKILTPEQFKKWEENHQDRRSKMRSNAKDKQEKRGHHNPGRRQDRRR